MARHAREHLVDGLDDHAALAHEVSRAQDRQRVVGERRRHVRTVRSAARARNRPRASLACVLLAVFGALLALLALTARAAAAAPGSTEISDDAAEAAAAEDAEETAAGSAPPGASGLAAECAEGAPLAGECARDELGGDALTEADAPDTDEPDTDELAGADGELAGADGELASVDDEIDPEGAEAALAIAAPGPARGLASQTALSGALEPIEAEPRPPRSSRWGRLDLMIAWHRAYDATDQGSSRRDELWLLAIWRR